MEHNFYDKVQDNPTPNRSTLLRFAAVDLDLYRNESLLFDY